MQRTILGFAAALSLVATALAPAAAQTIPSGSYQQSCTNIRVRGNQLTARCNAPQGGTVRTTINLSSCRGGDIANSNGQLTCNMNGNGYGNGRGRGHHYGRGNDNNNGNNGYGNNGNNGYGNNGNNGNNGYGNGRYSSAPGGSYQQSCTSARMRGSMLTATCTAPNGGSITSTIDASSCRGADIANVNGRLVCR